MLTYDAPSLSQAGEGRGALLALRRTVHAVSAYTALAVVALAPFPFGLTAPLPIAACCAALAFSLVTADFSGLRRAHAQHGLLIVAAAAVYVAAALLQMQPIATQILTPASIWNESGALLGTAPVPIVSWTIAGPWYALGPPLALSLAAVRFCVLCTDRIWALRLAKVVVISGCIYAAYGIVSHLVDPRLLLWRTKTAYLDAVTGTFVNRNTAATYWGSCAVVCLSMLMQKLTRDGGASSAWYRGLRHRSRWLPSAGLALLLLATAMTGSRAGTLLTLAVLTLVVCFYLLRPAAPRGSRWRVLAATLVGLALVTQLIGGLMLQRIQANGLGDERRLAAYRDTAAMIADHPLGGVGLGNFASVFPRYRSADLGSVGIWDRAHSTPIEMAAELGLPVTISICLSCVVFLYVLLRACFKRRRDEVFAVAGSGVALLGGLHSSIDFSVQIAGYGVVFAAIVGCGLAQSVSTRRSDGDQSGI